MSNQANAAEWWLKIARQNANAASCLFLSEQSRRHYASLADEAFRIADEIRRKSIYSRDGSATRHLWRLK